MFEGLYTALVTPFRNGKIDFDALEKIVEMQIAGGADGIIPMGTTGESPAVSHEDHKEFIKRVVGMVKKRIKVVAGTGSNSTEEAVSLSRAAEKYGADGVMLVVPYYNKPPQRGLITHFATITSSIAIPAIVYNIPGRTGLNFQPEPFKELLDRSPGILAVKEASGDINQMMRLIELCGKRLKLLSGDDNLLLPVLAIGGKGVVSVLSNIIPGDVKRVITLWNAGSYHESRTAFYRLLPLCRAMFYETNPIPVKAAMEMAGYCSGELRLPLTPMAEEPRARLRQALLDYGVDLC